MRWHWRQTNHAAFTETSKVKNICMPSELLHRFQPLQNESYPIQNSMQKPLVRIHQLNYAEWETTDWLAWQLLIRKHCYLAYNYIKMLAFVRIEFSKKNIFEFRKIGLSSTMVNLKAYRSLYIYRMKVFLIYLLRLQSFIARHFDNKQILSGRETRSAGLRQ